MHQRIVPQMHRLELARWMCHALRAVAGAGIVGAMALAAPVARAESETESDLPVLLLVQERTRAGNSQLDELSFRIKTTLRESITHSGRFQVHTFIPGDSVIKRALNEHLIAADDLAEPHKIEGLQRIAKAIGAKFILKYSTTLDKVEARTDLKFMDNPNQADWMVNADEHVTVPVLIGKKRLKPDDIVNLTVDAITARIGIPTHLAADLRIMPGSRIFEADGSSKKYIPEKTAKTTPKPPAADSTGVPPTPPDTRASTKTAKVVQNPTKQEKPARSASVDKPTRIASTQKPDPLKTAADPQRSPLDAVGNDQRARPVFTNEADPARSLPIQPSVAPPPVVPKADFVGQAARYRQTGDFSSAVVALRKAVNDKPHDIDLRRQLIQAYQSRQMPEAAHGEALRALRMDAGNANLYRLYGEVLIAEGDSAGAMLAFQDGIKFDPTDIGCQVALGDALLNENHFVQALDAYSAASKSDPKSPLPHRRMARALAAKAATDTDQYQASIAEIRTARELTPTTDTTSYQDDYMAIMRTVEARIREMLEELQAANQARVQTKLTQPELLRHAADIKERSAALADYLDKVPPAIGHDVTQAHYVQANALLSQSVGFFKDLIQKGDDRFADSMKSGQVQSQRELVIAGQRLTGTKANDKPRTR